MEKQKCPEIRFKGFNEAWEFKKLEEVGAFNPSSSLPQSFEYVDLESVVGTELLGSRSETIDSAPSRAQRLACKGDVFYQAVRPYQKNNYLFDLSCDNYVFSKNGKYIVDFDCDAKCNKHRGQQLAVSQAKLHRYLYPNHFHLRRQLLCRLVLQILIYLQPLQINNL